MKPASRADLLACLAIVAAGLAVTSPLLLHPLGVPPDDNDLDLDLMTYYGYAGAARESFLRFGQFPFRSPWHGGGYPLYAYPDDLTLTPTMLLVLAVGPWAAIKIDFVLTVLAGGLGMYFLARRRLGYSALGALFSATAFSLGGFLMARWLRGWRVPTHAAFLPVILFLLWRPARPGRRLATAALLVGWLLVDQKYVAVVMGWFLLMTGLLGLPGGRPAGARGKGGPDWRFIGRLVLAWGFGVGLAAVKLLPMAPLLIEHLRAEGGPMRGLVRLPAVLLWAVLLAALGGLSWAGGLISRRRTRPAGLVVLAGLVLATAAAIRLWAPPSRPASRLEVSPPTRLGWVRHAADCLLSPGTWRLNSAGVLTPTAGDRYRHRSPAGPVVAVLALAAVFLHPRRTWRWAVLAGLFLAFEFGPATPWELGESVRALPFLSWVRRPREQLNFYLFFLLTLLAGRALDPPGALRRGILPRMKPAAWRWAGLAALSANLLWVGLDARRRYAYTVSAEPPPAKWGPYQILDHRGPTGKPLDRWRDQPCFLLRSNVALQYWDCDFRDTRRYARRYLVPSLLLDRAGSYRPNPAFRGMAWFDEPQNSVTRCLITPNRVLVKVNISRPGTLVVNQVGDTFWRTDQGEVVAGSPLLAVRLDRVGAYEVRLTYVPVLFYAGLAVSAVVAGAGLALILLGRRRGRAPVAAANRPHRKGER